MKSRTADRARHGPSLRNADGATTSRTTERSAAGDRQVVNGRRAPPARATVVTELARTGDCLTYAIARLADQPRRFVGDDFRGTDVAAART